MTASRPLPSQLSSSVIAFAFFDAEATINGVNTWLLDLIPRLVTAGLDIRLISNSWCSAEVCYTAHLFRDRGFDVQHVSLNQSLLGQHKATLSIIRQQAVGKLVIGNLPTALSAALASGAKPIYVVHNMADGCPAFLQHLEACAKRTECTDFEVVLIAPAQTEIVPNGIPNSNVKYIPFGYDLATDRPPKAKNVVSLVYAGRFDEPTKRVVTTAKLLEQAAGTLPFELRCTFFGSGPAEADLKNVCSQAKHAKLEFGGLLPPDMVRPALQRHDGLILLSEYEGLPRTVLEAMSAGTVPVVSDIPSYRGLIKNNRNGLVIARNIESIRMCLQTLHDEVEWKRLSNAAEVTIDTYFSIGSENEKWQQILTETCPYKEPRLKEAWAAIQDVYKFANFKDPKFSLATDILRNFRRALFS